jgi:hypothetical protein
MTTKTRIVDELGEKALMLPDLVNTSLTANDRAKYLMTLLQTAREHPDHSSQPVADLKQERLACDLADHLEEAADALMHSALILRNYILGEVLTR